MAKKTAKNKTSQNSKNYTVAREDDGTIQIIFNIPYSLIQKEYQAQALELGKETEVPGFRKGNAPLDKLLAFLPKDKLIEKTLSKILPKMFGEALDEEKIKPIVYPKFEVLKAQENQDWVITAKTCEMPDIDLGDYKKMVKGELSSSAIWKPGDDKEKKQPTTTEKEQMAIQALIKNIKVKIPAMIIEDEVNNRLSRLLDQIDKLGLTVDSYLKSINKKIEDVKLEYSNQAQDSIALDLILTRIAQKEGLKIDQSEIDEAIKASSASTDLSQQVNTPEQKKLIENVLLKRKALSLLIN